VEQRFIQFFPGAPFANLGASSFSSPAAPVSTPGVSSSTIQTSVTLLERKPLLISRKRKSTGLYLYIFFQELKVPSCQIGSAREWYHWKGLKKDINLYMFLIF
jgi:hypothetical protein